MSGSTQIIGRAFAGHDQYDLTGLNGSRAIVVPDLGCNCIHWRAGDRELLFAPPAAELAERPTRGGIPVLFPFPNRIRAGRFTWAGRDYQLPCNDSTKANAIHGFTPRAQWRVLEFSADSVSAWLSAEFLISRDAPASRELWPGDPRLAVTIRLSANSLRYESTVSNASSSPLPFGLGFHPYFAASPGDRVESPARQRWKLLDGVPDGTMLPLDNAYDLRHARLFEDLSLDDVYTDFPATAADADGLIERGRLLFDDGRTLRVRTSPAFRDLVLFTPPHRKAICFEPYTCPTDAVNLTQRGLDVGWQVLAPGSDWNGVVEYRIG